MLTHCTMQYCTWVCGSVYTMVSMPTMLQKTCAPVHCPFVVNHVVAFAYEQFSLTPPLPMQHGSRKLDRTLQLAMMKKKTAKNKPSPGAVFQQTLRQCCSSDEATTLQQLRLRAAWWCCTPRERCSMVVPFPAVALLSVAEKPPNGNGLD